MRLGAKVDLDLVVRSHGWYDLPPFRYDERGRILTFKTLVDGRAAQVTVQQDGEGLAVSAGGGVTARLVMPIVRRVLDLDADLTAFHALCREREGEGFGWIAERGAGRILRAPNPFEDAVKVLATTNCSWALTKVISTKLIGVFDRDGTFPDAPFIAGLTEARLRQDVSLGYRAPFLKAFAEKVASGQLDLSRWEDRSRPDEEVEQEIRAHNGFGPYAAATLSRLLGRHGRLGLDSWSRKKIAALRFKNRKVKDARVERLYRGFGSHAGLAFWLDVTRDWHAGREALWG
ncbi:MAG: Fe-S cluster assembly protein HesB [Thermoanaerobaculia bacterium]